VALLAGAAFWAFWPDASGAAEERGPAGNAGAAPQGRTGPGGVDATGGGAETGASGSPSPSGTASGPGKGKGGSSGPSRPGSNSGPGGGSGGGSGGGGGGSGSGSGGPTARIDYFTVGTGAGCESSPVEVKYRITGSRNPTSIKYSIYFDGRLGRGHPISWAAEPSFSSGGLQEEDPGTHTYRMVLISPTHQEVTRTFKVC
jgi:hypothetical protein